jgi:hypothetical protein
MRLIREFHKKQGIYQMQGESMTRGILIFFLVAALIPAAGFEADLGGGHWKLERLAFVGNPPFFAVEGPALEALGGIYSIAFGANGEIYFTKSREIGIFVLKDGIVSRIAGMFRRYGYRDGPAERALFNPGGAGYPYNDLATDKNKGCLYFADGQNKRIRKIYKDGNGKWTVATFAGGGTTGLSQGLIANATSLNLGDVIAVTVDDQGYVWTAPWGYLVKISSEGQASVVLKYPDDGYPTYTIACDLTSDHSGNIYGVQRSQWDGVFKYSKYGVFTRLTYKERGDINATVDGPITTATFWGPTNIAVKPDGSAIYVGGGDEYCIRKIENGTVTTLQENGTWAEVTAYNQGWNLGTAIGVDEAGSIYLTNSQRKSTTFRKLSEVVP